MDDDHSGFREALRRERMRATTDAIVIVYETLRRQWIDRYGSDRGFDVWFVFEIESIKLDVP